MRELEAERARDLPIASHQIHATTIQFLRRNFLYVTFVAAQVSFFANPSTSRAAVTCYIHIYRAEVGIRQC